MSHKKHFRPNRPQVISQTIDGEVVVIHLQSGSYYSLTGTAASIWGATEAGCAAEDIPAWLQTRFTGCEPGLEGIVATFLAGLESENLIIPAEPVDAAHPASPETAPQPFSRPTLGKFTDMQELLLLDPIHEVDATGWPAQPNPSSDPAR